MDGAPKTIEPSRGRCKAPICGQLRGNEILTGVKVVDAAGVALGLC